MDQANKTLQVDRPEPIVSELEIIPFKRRMDPQEAVEGLLEGYPILIVDYYSSGLAVLKALKEYLKTQYPAQSFQEQRKFRAAFRELSHQVLLSVNNHRLSVKKAPEIGWLKILYPELNAFLLPFPQIQGLNSAWQWYEKGISIPVLDKKIHPFFGTYFPTRFEHLKLFEEWLKQYDGEKKAAIDVGIGSGILSFQLIKHGFEKVYGTDSNPNAIIGVREYLKRNQLESKIELLYGDLFAACDAKTELIVFNPPWLPAGHDVEGIDQAIYYDDELFPRFFDSAIQHLEPEGRVVLLFSNLGQITQAGTRHPIETELAESDRFQKEFFKQMNVSAASKKTQRNQHWRASEMVELWVLKMVVNQM